MPGAREAATGDLDVDQALGWRNFMVADWDDTGQVGWLESKSIDLVRGDGSIEGPGQVTVGDALLETERIVIATGSDPVLPPIPGLADLEGVWTNREATALKEVPRSLLVVRGGAVGVELGQAIGRMGSQVTIVEGESRLLPGEAPGIGEALAGALEAEGVTLRLGEFASSAERAGDEFVLRFEEAEAVHAERLLIATGRKPRLDGLGVEKLGIEPGRAGIEVDERLRAGEGVWAIGDVTGVALFTHVGKYQARVAAADMLGREAAPVWRCSTPTPTRCGCTGGGRSATTRSPSGSWASSRRSSP